MTIMTTLVTVCLPTYVTMDAKISHLAILSKFMLRFKCSLLSYFAQENKDVGGTIVAIPGH